MSELTDKIEEAIKQVEELCPTEITPEVEKKLVEANERLKEYKKSNDKRGYLRALADALILYRSIVVPALQKQEMLRLKSVLAMAKVAEQRGQSRVRRESVSAAPQGLGALPLALAPVGPSDASQAVSGLRGGLSGGSRRSAGGEEPGEENG